MDLKVKWWLEKDGGLVLGKGRCMLLKAIDQRGSLREAARVCGISYRAAWGKLRASEERLGEALAESQPGKRGQLFGPGWCSTRRHIGFLIPTQNCRRIMQVGDVF